MTTTPMKVPIILLYLWRFFPNIGCKGILSKMQDFAKRRKTANIIALLKSLAGLLFLLIITFLAVRAAWGMYGKFAEAASSDERAHQQLAQLQQQETQVASTVDSFNSNRGLEAEVRERYGVVKPGEGQIQIVRDASSTEARAKNNPNVFIRIWDALFGWI